MYDCEQIDYKGLQIKTYYDDNPIDPRGDYCLGKFLCFHKRYCLGDKHEVKADDFSGWAEVKKYLKNKLNAVVILPLYLYDHSGISLSSRSFVGRAVHAEWDSGQVGFAYITRETLKQEYGVKRVGKKTLEKAEKLLEGEIKIYDQYLQGNVYGYQIWDDEEEIDSCWGFIGEDYYDEMVNECKSIVDSYLENVKAGATEKII